MVRYKFQTDDSPAKQEIKNVFLAFFFKSNFVVHLNEHDYLLFLAEVISILHRI